MEYFWCVSQTGLIRQKKTHKQGEDSLYKGDANVYNVNIKLIKRRTVVQYFKDEKLCYTIQIGLKEELEKDQNFHYQ